MSEHTVISWCDSTWSPVWGCTEVSKAETGGGGCDNCYARTLAHRFGYGWNGAPMREFGNHHWAEPVRWNRRAQANGTRPRVFPSMCDPLDKDWPAGVRDRFWRLVDATPYLTWLILTKRIGNYASYGPGAVIGRHPANVWLGATVVNQLEADRDIPKLLATPARVRFLSAEPLLGPVDLTAIRVPLAGESYTEGNVLAHKDSLNLGAPRAAIDWVICGGESGPQARPMHPDWVRSLRDQCAAAGVPFHFKQWGEHTSGELAAHPDYPGDGGAWRLDQMGRRWHDPMESLKPRDQWAPVKFTRPGKAAAGRLLDGVEHNGFPR